MVKKVKIINYFKMEQLKMDGFNHERSERWRLASWLENHCKRNSENWQDYEKAKAFLKTTNVDYDAGIKIITDYLNV